MFMKNIYKFNIKIQMKNFKADKTSPLLSLASKRAALNQDKISQPYKIDWDANPLQSIQSKSSNNKNFFQNMKEQLSTIKNDFEKLVKKQTSFGSAAKTIKQQGLFSNNISLGGGMKGKSMSAYQKATKKLLIQKFDDLDKCSLKINLQETENSKPTISTHQKDQSNIKQQSNKTIQTKQKQHNKDNPISKTSKKSIQPNEFANIYQHYRGLIPNKDHKTITDCIDQKHIQKQQQNVKLKATIDKLNQQTLICKKDKQILQKQIDKLKNDSNLLLVKMRELSQELTNKMEYAEQQELKIKILNEQARQKQQIILTLKANFEQLQKQFAFDKQKMSQLLFHNQNFHNINCELGNQNHQLKVNLQNMHNFIENIKSINQNTENDYKRKLEFMKKDIEQYEKRQSVFAKEIQTLSQQLRAQAQHPTENCHYNQDNLSQITYLKNQITQLKKQVQFQKEINRTVTVKYEQSLKKVNFQGLAASLEKNMNQIIQENGAIKNKISILEANLQSALEQNRSYLREIQLYQQRQQQAKKKITSNQWEELIQQIEQLTQQKQQLTQKLELKQLKQDVTDQSQKKFSHNDNILKLVNSQLNEIQNLKSDIRNLKNENENLYKKVLNQGTGHIQLKGKLKKQNDLSESQEYELKDKQISTLKHLIFKVLVQKVNKSDSQNEIQYYLKKLQQIKPLLDATQ